MEIGPGRSADMTIRFDPAEEPDFRGRLTIGVTGLGPTGAIVFQTHVDLEVRAEE